MAVTTTTASGYGLDRAAAPRPLARIASVTCWIALGLALGVAATGLWLWFTYRPSAAQAWPDLVDAHGGGGPGAGVAQPLHRLLSHALVAVSLLAAVTSFLAAREAGRFGSWRAVVWPVAAAASFSGYLVAWDQLALWSVTAGTSMQGMAPLFSDQVRFVLIGGAEVSPSTVARFAAAHVVAGAAVLALLVPRRRRPA